MAQSKVPLREDFKATVKLVRKLRKIVREDPLVPGKQPDSVQFNPAASLLGLQEIHLRGLAGLIGALEVEKELMEEFRQASEMARELMPLLEDAPLTEGEKNSLVRNPYGVLLGYAQTHVRGCAALLQKAKSSVSTTKQTGFDDLFAEPTAEEIERVGHG
jgi:hypothetical protein